VSAGGCAFPAPDPAYAGRVALFLGWCQAQGVDWRRIGLPDMARFKRWLEVCPGRGGRSRSGSTVNAVLAAVCEFLRFCARTGLVEPIVAARLSEPRWLRFTPPGFDVGESGQFRTVRARSLKSKAETPFPEALSAWQAEAVLACCRRPRERFLVTLLLDTELRIGEALGCAAATCTCCRIPAAWDARRWVPTSMSCIGRTRTARWQNPVPAHLAARDAVLAGYADYQYERAETVGETGNGMVLVNLYHEPLGAPLTYRAAKRFLDRLAGECAFPVRPVMLRHSAATNWIRAGADIDLVRSLLGHARRWPPRRLPALDPGRGIADLLKAEIERGRSSADGTLVERPVADAARRPSRKLAPTPRNPGMSGIVAAFRGCSSVAELQLPKLIARVRFSSPAPRRELSK